ncbi:MAG: VOC family protein [Armatimonadota bacterium]
MLLGDFDAMLYVRDVRRSVDFYVNGLGFTFGGWWDDSVHDYNLDLQAEGDFRYARLSAGPQPLALHATDAESAPGGGAYFHLRVEAVDAYHRAVTGHGVEAVLPSQLPWGWRMFTVTDPDGHHWGFYTPVAGAES